MRPKGEAILLERRRLAAMAMLDRGETTSEAAQAVGVSSRAIRLWRAAYKKLGGDALKAKPVPGRPRKYLTRQS